MAKYRQPNMEALMKQAQKMQQNMEKAQQELLAMEFEGSAGGGAVKIVLGGDKLVRTVVIDPEVVNSEDAEILCDMLVAAFNDAVSKCEEITQSRMGALTGGMKLPGM